MGGHESGWYNVGNGQLQYKDSDGWTEQYQNVTGDAETSSGPGSNGPPSQPTKPVRSKLAALIAGAAAVVILAALGVYYVAFRSLPTTVSWAPSASAIAPGSDLAVSGRVTPAASGRHVLFESAPNAQGPWQPMPQTATTDSGGRFALTFKPQFTGLIVMRVVIDPAGRYLAVTGQSKPVRLLATSSISLKGGGTIPTLTRLSFTITADPPSAGRTVRIEQSSDKVRWVPVGTRTQTKTDGSAVVNVPAPGVGVWSYRATVAKDDKFAAAVSPVVGATVEDIKAAAATYLSIISQSNTALHTFNNAIDRNNRLMGLNLSVREAATYSAANTATAAKLRAYNAWPQSVKPLIDLVIAQFVISADNLHQLSAVTSVESWDTVMTEGEASDKEISRLSTLIRQALGLPQRPTS